MDKKLIPELPKDVEELRILFKTDFEAIVKDKTEEMDIGNYKEIDIRELELKCPHCHNQFDAKRKIYGSIITSTDPNVCPYCDFPKSVLCALIKKRQQKIVGVGG